MNCITLSECVKHTRQKATFLEEKSLTSNTEKKINNLLNHPASIKLIDKYPASIKLIDNNFKNEHYQHRVLERILHTYLQYSAINSSE